MRVISELLDLVIYSGEDNGVIFPPLEFVDCRRHITTSGCFQRGVKGIKAYDASRTHVSKLVAECWRASHIVLAASTYNNGIFTPIENLLIDLKAHAFQNRTWALIENGTWAPQSGKLIRAMVEEMKDMTVLGDTITLKSAMQSAQENDLAELADLIVANLKFEL